MSGPAPVPDGLLDAFWAYERALMGDDLAAMDRLFADSPTTLRGDPGGLLEGHDVIGAFRSVRGGAPPRRVLDVHVQPVDDRHALVVAVTAPTRGGRGLQTQLWRHDAGRWAVSAAHVSPAPVTFDPSVWRVVGDPLVPPAASGPLDGETVAVKDLFAVAGHPVGAGVPAYLAEQEPEQGHATALQRLLDAGAGVRGIARTDQFAYSLAGDNEHYGTPVNPVVAGALPGGSSSGSATAVSLGAATLGLATDTAGSVRVPASYQGLWGLRTTHGAAPDRGLLALAPSFDTVGLLTRDGDLLGRAAAALLGDAGRGGHDARLVTAPALLDGVAPGVARSFHDRVGRLPSGDRSEVLLPRLDEVVEAFRVCQAWEAWRVHGAWIRSHPRALRGAAAARFEVAAGIDRDQHDDAAAVLARARADLDDVLGDRVLVLPSTSAAAPRLWDGPGAVDAVRAATFRLTCLAGVTGRPAVSVPVLEDRGDPVGLCLVGPRGCDLALVETARMLATT